ncbi:C-signal-like [Trichomycterus rosablanca]|uniref:C-signal-like n=1 Tax=Trichomycterus rosablanca TaxID=2290929 RepID=UPI002F35E4BA
MSINFSQCNSVLITGGNRGLGLQIIKHLVSITDRPKKIISTARNPAAAQELQKLAQSHSEVYILPLDVVNEAGIEAAVKEVASIVGPAGLTCLINNAGMAIHDDINTVTRDNMLTTFQCNAVAPLFITKAFLPLLRAAAASVGGGSKMGVHRSAVINMSSIAGSIQENSGKGEFTKFKVCSYRVSKAALNMATRCLAIELKSDGILCVTLHPGWVRTDMGGEEAHLSPEESISSLLAVISKMSEKDHGEFLDYKGNRVAW